MVCEPVSVYHELPGQRLSGLATRIAQMRGSPIETIGAADLLLRDADGAYLRILEADQTVYLHPRTTRPAGPAIEVGSDTLPDVVLEVDNTTDVRRGKLALYESWGFPEVWVEVPEQASPSRPAGLRPGLTIHLLESGRFRPAASSRAFPGWTAQEIHQALNEREVSYVTMAALRRVGRTLGAAVGTGPDNDPLLRAERLQSHAKGRAEGHAEGHAEGRAEGHAEGRAEGHAEGRAEGHAEGRAEGHAEGRAEGHAEGRAEGHAEGRAEGHAEGRAEGHAEGRAEGHAEGRAEGHAEGRAEGHAEGRAEGHAEGRAEGHAEGRAEGHAEGRAEGRTEALVETQRDAVLQVLQVLKLRGLPVSATFPRRLVEFKAVSTATLVQAALDCRDEADFLRLLRQQQH